MQLKIPVLMRARSASTKCMILHFQAMSQMSLHATVRTHVRCWSMRMQATPAGYRYGALLAYKPRLDRWCVRLLLPVGATEEDTPAGPGRRSPPEKSGHFPGAGRRRLHYDADQWQDH